MKRSSNSLPRNKGQSVCDHRNESFENKKMQVPSKSMNGLWGDLRRELDLVNESCHRSRSRSLGSSKSSVQALEQSTSTERSNSWRENRRTSSKAERSFVNWLPTNLENEDDDDLSHDCSTDRFIDHPDAINQKQLIVLQGRHERHEQYSTTTTTTDPEWSGYTSIHISYLTP